MTSRTLGLALLLALGACAEKPQWRRVRVYPIVDEAANAHQPVAVSFVVARDAVEGQVAALDARGWFATRAALQRDHPEGFQEFTWEWIPGQPVEPIDLTIWNVSTPPFVFARYREGTPHRVRVAERCFRILIGVDEVTIEPR